MVASPPPGGMSCTTTTTDRAVCHETTGLRIDSLVECGAAPEGLSCLSLSLPPPVLAATLHRFERHGGWPESKGSCAEVTANMPLGISSADSGWLAGGR